VIRSYCLDTNIVLLLLRGKELGRSIDQTFGLSAAPYMHTLSIVTHAELRVLGDRNGWQQNKWLALDKALQEFVTVDVSGGEMVEAYRKIEQANASFAGGHRVMGQQNDIWIAATAMVTGLAVLTTDRDFNHLNGSLLEVHYISPKLS
jgi:tRNA(fMet)-specific endonuclease VapC